MGIYSRVNPIIVRNDKASTDGLRQAFEAMAPAVRPRDVFVLFVAGHGKTIDGMYHFIPHEFLLSGRDAILASAVSQDTLKKWLATIRARKSVTIYDTCESGTLTGEGAQATRSLQSLGWLDRMTRATGRTVLAGSRGDQPAVEGHKGHGVFTYGLLDAISSALTDEVGNVTVSSVADHLDRVVPLISETQVKMRQVPLRAMSGTNFPLVRRTKVLPPRDADSIVIPLDPTHALLRDVVVIDAQGQPVGSAKRGMRVVVMKTDPATGRTMVARQGHIWGYIAEKVDDVLLPLQ